MSHTKIRALQQWCKALVDGYKDVNITNMSTSWRDGLAFCAVIHRFRPDLINFDALSKHNIYDNNQLAFTVAESLGIAALLEAKDMLDLPVPDKLSVITYVASIHNYFKDKEKLGGPGISTYKGGNIQIGTKRHQDNDSLNTTEPKRSTPDQSEEKAKRIGSPPTRQRSPADDRCTLCRERVYLIEKQIDNGKLYHRSCFRGSRMSPTNKFLSKSLFNGAGDLATSKVEPSVSDVWAKTEWQATTEKANPATKARLYEKRKEQVQKAEEQLKTERQKEKELYEKRHNAPSALRNHLKNMDNQSGENSKNVFSKQPSLEKNSTKALRNTEQQSWVQTKLRKVFNDLDSSSSTAPGKEASPHQSSSSAHEQQSRESSPGSPVLMKQVTSRTMEDKQYHASKTVTKSATNIEAESGKQHLVSGLLKSLANVRQRQNSAGTTSPTSSPPPPKSPSGPPPFTKLSVTQKPLSPGPATTNSFPFSQPLNSATPVPPMSTSTTSQAQTKVISKIETQAKNKAPVAPKEQAKSMARIKSVITSSPTNPVVIPKTSAPTAAPVSTSALSAKSKVTNKSLPSFSASTTKSNATKIASENSSSHSASPAKTNISKITSDMSSHSSSSAKSDVSRITSESSVRSPSTAKSNISKSTSETSPSHSASTAKSNLSKITSETSSSRSTSPARLNQSKATTSLQNDLPPRPAVSKATTSTSTTKDDKPQSILDRIEQYSKVAAGIEKPATEQSPKREILLNNNHKREDQQSPLKQNALTTSTHITTIGIKKPLASESSKERNTVSRHVASPATPKTSDDKAKSVLPSVKTYADKNKQASVKTGITKDVKQPSLESHQTPKPHAEKSSAPAFSPKKLPPVKQVAEEKKSKSADSELNALSIGRTRLHPAHYLAKESDPNPRKTTVTSNTITTMQPLDTKINPIPKPKRQKPGLTQSTVNENKENPVDNKVGSSNGVTSHKTPVALSERQDMGDSSKTEWQLEAERRIAARKGKYIDPETHITRFMLPESDKKTDNERNGEANQNTRPQAGMKKISLSQNWTFEDDNSLNSNTSLDFPYRKQIVPKEDLESLELNIPKKRLSTDEIQKELKDIDSKLTDLELRGRQLEVTIRAANEDDEKFMVEWFQLINEKNKLVRRENDLIYQSQEHELEEEQIRIDKELQVLMMKPYEKKTKAEKRKEEALIHQKIAIVNQRNLIVDSIDENRLMYEKEDEGIKEVLQNKGYLQV